MASQPHARVLAIASLHVRAGAVFSRLAAQFLLTSEPKISIPPGGSQISGTTDLRDSVFFRLDKGTIVPCRQSISAVLLVAISNNQSSVVGVLHPEPAMRFDIRAFPKVPFVAIKSWPIAQGRIETEWVVAHPDPEVLYHSKIQLTDKELKGEK